MHARRVRPDTGPIDRRRLAAAGLSAVLPGLGQAFNRRSRLAVLFLGPSLLLIAVAVFLLDSQSTARLAAWAASPFVLATLLTLNVLVLAWRLLAVGQAFLDTRRSGPTGRLGVGGIAVLAILVVIPHLVIYQYGTVFRDTFAQVFDPSTQRNDAPRPVGPASDERLTILLVGADRSPSRTTNLTDTMIVASIDPVGKSVSMVSVPRDLIDVPLGDGNEYGPKLNSLMEYADRRPDEFPDGGMATLQRAIGALLGVDIHYHAEINLNGFRKMVDAVGGVDVEVARPVDDPTYDGGQGFSLGVGRHHLDGKTALAYVRSRKGAGDSDFTRALRQQQVLVALRDAVTEDGSLLWELPDLLRAVGGTISTDLPYQRLPALAALADEVDRGHVVSALVRHPLVRSVETRYGSSLQPDLVAIRKVAAGLFPEPGLAPKPWPTPKTTPKPSSQP